MSWWHDEMTYSPCSYRFMTWRTYRACAILRPLAPSLALPLQPVLFSNNNKKKRRGGGKSRESQCAKEVGAFFSIRSILYSAHTQQEQQQQETLLMTSTGLSFLSLSFYTVFLSIHSLPALSWYIIVSSFRCQVTVPIFSRLIYIFFLVRETIAWIMV